jgi:uncharacterized protein (TIGR04255 family)
MTTKIVPYNEDRGNAIRSVLFIFEFVEPLLPHAMADFEPGGAMHVPLKDKLPKFAPQQQMVMTFAPNMMVGTQQFQIPTHMTACTFERFDRKGDVALGLNIQPTLFTIACGDYTRWNQVHDQAIEILNILSPWLQQNAIRTNSFTLQYHDEFNVTFGAGSDRSLIDLLSAESPYMARNVVNAHEEFHSHHGYFKQPDCQIPGRLLNNINVNANLLGAGTVVQIQCVHKYHAASSISIIDQDGSFSKELGIAFEYLHQENKQIVGALLTEPVKKQIAFDSGRV